MTNIDNTDAVRSLIFQHSDPKTFLKYYLHRKVDKDVRAIVQGLDPQKQIIRAACRMIRAVNPRRLQELTTKESSSVNQQPHIKELIEKRDCLSVSDAPLPDTKALSNMSFTPESAVNWRVPILSDLDARQLSLDLAQGLLKVKLFLFLKRELVSSPLTLQDEMLRRTEAIDAVVDYCRFEEGEACRLPHEKRPGPKVF
ncbi:hypothetical protein EMCG_04462 [[Emmonsia] crescens]|uniref:Uncharacterized protein n=1 Tax=[Emmonsia] crescens TaxID=73230 RepID=A0A0G2J7E4_9EURO|nr:hypothetical protein EMCG_04462 [Emmonsia crescens UAMH 3008]